MRFLQKFMLNRRGLDRLSIALLFLYFILSFLFVFIPRDLVILRLISFIPPLIALYRIFSKNIVKRQQEEDKFMRWWYAVLPKIQKKVNRIKDNKTYKFIKCPNCKQLLRLPRGRGKIRISCPKCSHSFERKT